MLYRFPGGTKGMVRVAYTKPYDDPICVRSGETVTSVPGKVTDIVGWVWCTGPDGKSGWVPEAWIDRTSQPWRLRPHHWPKRARAAAPSAVAWHPLPWWRHPVTIPSAEMVKRVSHRE